jgi:NAD(P)-dependent dehydrogenase (short-subunit alcohol dehydrogenase family)
VLGTVREPALARDLRACAAAVHALDVTDPDSVRALAEALAAEPVDLLIANAGHQDDGASAFGDLDYAAWAERLETDLFGPLRVAEALLPSLRAGLRRQVATIAGPAGGIQREAVRAAVRAATQVAARELAWQGFTLVVLQPAAEAAPAAGARKLRRVLDGLATAHTGTCLDSDGTPLPG